jgi:hypothetical protein
VFLVEAKHGIVNRQYRTAAIAENGVDALVGQDLNEYVRTAHDGAGLRVRSLILLVGRVLHAERLAVLSLAPKQDAPVS